MRICIPIREKTAARAIYQIRRANSLLRQWPKSCLEIWLDSFSQPDIEQILKVCKKLVIAVCRGEEEKGSFRGALEEKIDKLKFAVSCGAKYVDIGGHEKASSIKELQRFCKKHVAKLIISHHFWNEMPGLVYLEKLILKSKAHGADIVKIAAKVFDWSENVTLFELTKRMTARQIPVIIIGMGEQGKISRFGCPLLGSFLTYVAANAKSKTAPGQVLFKEYLELCRSK